MDDIKPLNAEKNCICEHFLDFSNYQSSEARAKVIDFAIDSLSTSVKFLAGQLDERHQPRNYKDT